jgi:acyl carrier protein
VKASALSDALLAVVSEKTGYPADMLELSMDMEADLGIDSIKRVEILGAMRAKFPELPAFKAEELAELRTLQQIVDYMNVQVGGDTNPAPAPSAPVTQASATVAVPVPVTAPQNGSGVSGNELADALLVVVSEKTGYPADMLDMSMDMEADLGIDSIKRVEILGAMRAKFPELPAFKAEELAELRTLQQIVDYMSAQVEVQPNRFFKVAGDIPRSPVALKILPRPDFLDFDVPENAVCVITDDGSPLTADLVHEMKARGWQVVVISFPATLFPPSSGMEVRQIRLLDWSEEQLKGVVDLISSQYGSIQAFIHLNPTSKRFSRNGDIFLEQEKIIIKSIFLLAKYLKPALTAPTGRRSFMTVARLDGMLGIDGHIGAIASGLFGLTKSLNLEWESVHCRAVDLAPDIPPGDAARHIVAELHDPNRLVVEVAYGSAGRVTLVAEQKEAYVTQF